VADFVVPELGENVAAGDVVRILVKPGDALKKDQPVLELETDKATIEVPSSVAGVVKEIKVKQGQKVKVGEVVLTVDDSAAAAAPTPQAAEASAAPAAPAPPAAPAQPAPPAAQAAQPAQAAQSGQPAAKVVDINRGASSRPAAATSAPPAASSAAAQVPAAPSTRRYARELGVDITSVEGSGPGGRVSMDDVKAEARSLITGGGGRPAAVPLPDFTQWGEVELQPLKNIRRITAERMAAAWSTVPHVTQCDKADITELEKLRQKYGKKVEKAGGKLTITAIALKVIAAALKTFPDFNASLDVAQNTLILKKYVHIGVAVDTERGLLVPVIRDVDRKNIAELSVELATIAEKTKAGKLQPAEMQGASFTISNLGGIGGTYFTPIVNAPEVAILGMSRSVMEPVWTGESFEPRLMMPLSLSYDHRVIDGANGIRFLRWVCEAFEQPFLLSLEG
jgi:pyruvate dehydrogenase E2 component (dihydrolipoyllysine-residue acetyltransferase)